MKLEVLENEKEKIKIEVPDITFVNLLNENIWKEKAQSAYNIDHPYLSKPVLIVRSRNPKKTIVDATERVLEEIKSAKKHFHAAAK